MGRNLVVCLDGTSNEPEAGVTNVARLYDLAVKDETQLVYYDPGVGTMGARGATTPLGKKLTQAAGLVIGYGVRDNIAEAYEWLMEHYTDGDRIYLFGFSRGAYTALALAGMLRTVGLLQAGTENLAPYALKLYATNGPEKLSPAEEKKYWAVRQDFDRKFGNPAFERFAPTIRYLGLWDTVKSTGWLNAKARFEQARWPFTRRIANVATARHALSIDENRRPFPAYRLKPDPKLNFGQDVAEQWFAGVHSDVGGQYPDDHRLSDIALGWIADEAAAAGLLVDKKRYAALLGVEPGEKLPAAYAVEGKIHRHGRKWFLLGGWKPRRPKATDTFHPSVQQRIDGTAGSKHPYRPKVGP